MSVSSDGGLTWDRPTIVDPGVGCDLDNFEKFNDKEWIITDNDPSSRTTGGRT